MAYKDPNKAKEYMKAWYEAHKESEKAKMKVWEEEHKDERKAYLKEYKQAHKEEIKEYDIEYKKSDLNSLGETKHSIRHKSQRYLKKYGTKIPGYEIHHCCTYDDPTKFIYCPIEMHDMIHSYLKAHNIDADSDHYEQIKHLIDDSVVKYNIE